MIEDKIQIDEEIKKLPFIEHYKKMWPFVKPYMFRAILAILICIPIGALDSVVALSLKPYMDIVLVDKTESSPAYIPLLIVAFTSVQGFLNYAATYLNTWVGTKINQDLKRAYIKNCCIWKLLIMTSIIPVLSFSASTPTATLPAPVCWKT